MHDGGLCSSAGVGRVARALSLATAVLLVGACGSEEDGGAKGQSGSSGSAGSSGSSGSSGSAGSAGSSGSAGTGGSAGTPCTDDPSAPSPSVSIAPVTALVLPDNRADLVATATSPNGAIVAYDWTQASGPSTATLLNATEASALAAGLVEGSYTFSVKVRDAKCREAEATVDVRVGAGLPLPNTPLGQIRQYATPVFKQGHTLPPLTYSGCGWSNPPDVEYETELVEKYGYAYSLHRADSYWNGLLDNAGSDVAIKVAKNKADPERYKLFTQLWRPLWDQEEFRPEPLSEYLNSALPSRCSGCAPPMLSADGGWLSPAADQRFYDLIGADSAQWLLPYKQRGIPLAVVYNMGEDDFGTGGGSCAGNHWDSDPVIVQDLKTVLGVSTTPACGTKAWAQYASKRNGQTQQRITDKVVATLPASSLYVRYRVEGNLNRERYGSWYDYAPFYEDTKNNSTLPNMSAYFAGDEPPYYHFEDSAWDPNTDFVTATLASIAWQIHAGSPLSYNSVSGGWPTATHTEVAPADRYMGYLKVLYAAGNVGAVASWWSPGLFQSASGEWTCDPNVTLGSPVEVPLGVTQYVALGEVHALFSHFEDFLRNGSLVPGPGIQRFTVSHPPADQVPAYELVCDSGTKLCDRALRVLARKHDARNEWIVVAFAATGPDKDVSVDLPGAGSISVRCRTAGSLYHVTASGSGAPSVELVDVDPMHPTDLLAP